MLLAALLVSSARPFWRLECFRRSCAKDLGIPRLKTVRRFFFCCYVLDWTVRSRRRAGVLCWVVLIWVDAALFGWKPLYFGGRRVIWVDAALFWWTPRYLGGRHVIWVDAALFWWTPRYLGGRRVIWWTPRYLGGRRVILVDATLF